jgi:propionyl-CoA carboxylase alpha chain
MFKKILIANRGEIACRIIRTARAMGIRTVAVYSDADTRSLHVDMADEKVNIGPAAAAQSYLMTSNILDACRKTSVEAVHPGYGFLSERSEFARAVAEAGMVFIGPNPEAIDAMGDKIESKKTAQAVGVSTVPGHLGMIADVKEAARIANQIGFPVMIKASAGGGGKGMRVARNPDEVHAGFERARSEARSSFGDDRVFIEKFISNPRHIEIQLLGDKHGNIIHLGERECSIQRRNQKVIEEAPSTLLNEATRAAMGEQAIALAQAVGYDSAGTVEFVVEQDRSFYFLEMNTRLQVEHPVTELVTGIDIVEQMIRVAAGEPLAIKQSDVHFRGWAIESRIYAEDPYHEFLPSTGRLTTYRQPVAAFGQGVTVRNDTGVQEGGEISIWYDPMVAKLCTHAPSRAGAIAAMSSALDEFAIEGIEHNIPFVAAIMQNKRWQKGELSTGFIAEEFEGGFNGVAMDKVVSSKFAHIARELYIFERQKYGAKPTDTALEVKVADDWHSIDGAIAFEIGPWRPGDKSVSAMFDGGVFTCQVRRTTSGYRLMWRGVSAEACVYSLREAELLRLMPAKKKAAVSRKLICPMPGLVVSISVAEGQHVKAGAQLAVVEAMKMENILRTERDVKILKILVAPGDSIAAGADIMEFE